MRVRLPIDWLLFAAIIGSVAALFTLGLALLFFWRAFSSGHPAPLADVPRVLWAIGAAGLGAPLLAWELSRLGVVELVRLPRGDYGGAFKDLPLMDPELPDNLVRRGIDTRERAWDGIFRSSRLFWPVVAVYIFLSTPKGEALWLDFLDAGSVKVFGWEYGVASAAILAAGFLFLGAVMVQLAREFVRLQRR